jgi:hypothetical protein
VSSLRCGRSLAARTLPFIGINVFEVFGAITGRVLLRRGDSAATKNK